MTSKYSITRPLNDTQRQFNVLCEFGGGRGGGPLRGQVQELLRATGKKMNVGANEYITARFAEMPEANPWHVCFAVGLSWGHLAQPEPEFTMAAVNLMTEWNDTDIKVARRYPNERGPEVVEASLLGGYQMFQQVRLPPTLPTTLSGYRDAQNRWLSPILSGNRPRFIGSWNACAMFMVGLFFNQPLADQMLTPEVSLPPGGPVYAALSILYRAQLTPQAPEGTELDDEAYQPGAIFINNSLMSGLLQGLSGWSMTNVHSGLYMLGTRRADTDVWFKL